MDFLKNIPTVETIPGTDKGSVYVVVAKKGDAKLALKPEARYDTAKKRVLLAGRVRCTADPYEENGASFGFKLEPRGAHSSNDFSAPLAFDFISGTEFHTLLQKHDACRQMAKFVLGKMAKKKLDFVLDEDTLTEYLQAAYAEKVVDKADKYPDTLEFTMAK